MNARKFKNWMRRNPNKHWFGGDSDGIQRILNGDKGAIMGNLTWAYMPQGGTFWHEVYLGRKMSKRTRQFLAKLRDEAKRRGC